MQEQCIAEWALRGIPMRIELTPDELRPLIESVAADLLSRFVSGSDRIAFDEAEAAAMLGVAPSTLGDERRRGRVRASLVGRKIRYTREDLLTYLASRQWKE